MGGGEGLGPFQNIYIYIFPLWSVNVERKSDCICEYEQFPLLLCWDSKDAGVLEIQVVRSSNFWNGYAFVPQKKEGYICIYHHLVYFTLLNIREKSICWRSTQGSPRESSNCSLFSKHREIIWTRDKAKSPIVKLFDTMARTFVVPLSNVKRSWFWTVKELYHQTHGEGTRRREGKANKASGLFSK